MPSGRECRRSFGMSLEDAENSWLATLRRWDSRPAYERGFSTRAPRVHNRTLVGSVQHVASLVEALGIDLDDAAVGIQNEDLCEAGRPGRIEAHGPRVGGIRLRMCVVAATVSQGF